MNREAGEGEAEDTNETHHEREIYMVNAMRVSRTTSIRISWAAPFAPQLLGHRPCPRGIIAVATSIYYTPRP